MRRFMIVVRIAAFSLWAAGILWLSLTSHPPHIRGILGWDKLQHAAAYGLLALLGGWTFTVFFRSRERAWLTALFFAFCFGALLEIAQGLFTSLRTPEIDDLVADFLGAGVVYFLARFYLGILSRPNRNALSDADK